MISLHAGKPKSPSADHAWPWTRRDHSLRAQQIEAEQTRLLYAHAPTSLVVTLFNTGLVTVGLRNVIAPSVLGMWCAAMVVITLARFILLQQYRRTAPPIDQLHRWRTWFILGAGCAGLGWGSAGMVLFAPDSFLHQLFVVFVLGGMIIGGVAVLSPVTGAFVAFVVPTALPIMVRFFLQEDELFFAMGGMTLVFSGALLTVGRHLHTTVTEFLTLRFDNRELIHDLSVTEQHTALMKQAHAELLEAKKAAEAANRTKSEFLATMSHELRTPLHIILGYTDLLHDGTFGPLTTEQATPLRRIDLSARELLDLITTMLDVSRLEAGRLPLAVSSVNVAQVLTELQYEAQALHEQAHFTFVWRVEEPLPLVQTDLRHLKVILKNLLGNATKFTEEGQITITAQGHAGGVEIQIADTGIGIAPEALSQIFEPFYQVDSSDSRKSTGTGLGLYIVRRLSELLGGTVNVESQVGHGTTFRVWIPTRPPAGPAR